MKIFLFRFNSPMLIDVARNLVKEGHEILYWEASKKYFDAVRKSGEFKNTVFHSTYEAVRGVPSPDIEDTLFPSVGKDFLDELLSCESQVLSMMMSVDYDSMPLLQKKKIFYEYVRYSNGLIDKLKPEAIVFGDIPHIAHQYTLYKVAKLKGIKTIMFRTIPVLGRLIFLTDHTEYKELKNTMDTIKEPVVIDDLSEDMKKYYLLQTNLQKDATPFYMKDKYRNEFKKIPRLLPSFAIIFQHIQKGTFLKTVRGYIKMNFFIKRKIASLDGIEISGFALKRKEARAQKIKEAFRKEYESLVEPIDYKKKYIYVALHKQPEASTSAMGGVFTDQILMVDILSQALPKNWILYVKESIIQWENPRGELGRYSGYYKNMKKRDNIKFIDASTNTFKLIEHAKAIATVTGTVGWEAILRGKPALIFGYIWYSHCDGAFRVVDVPSCKEVFNLIEKGRKPDKQKVLNFLKALDITTVKAFPNLRFKEDAGISIEENIKVVTKSILEMLKS